MRPRYLTTQTLKVIWQVQLAISLFCCFVVVAENEKQIVPQTHRLGGLDHRPQAVEDGLHHRPEQLADRRGEEAGLDPRREVLVDALDALCVRDACSDACESV